MRIVIQRAKKARVTVDGKTTGAIDHGLVCLVGVTEGDGEEDVRYLADKLAHLRIFEDEQGKMNHSLLDVGGSVLSVSQFTLYGDCRKGRRPNFMAAAPPDVAEKWYERLNEELKAHGVPVETGVFGAMMEVELTNDGPVTLILESKK
ncbi:MAG: D-aminoacyl-tRNA deacylase [Firmicutes bacterium]|uniref:D-aminoacyl-tRNA deacylase n=1 Tax=Melghirimyces thermohalophilus TaxID=1236220 RepID=A0A1G6QEP7_9BACL|nr:D-aminoacyl-tRNA deacylase [Melghirimyces thermohalophilus]MDA8352907.1 D-aminoacyl-tRNA deacylase [Bacillota bacterium]SDC90157.1 D-tyrosyl-tRNA(Tyr) deacylase [Melghirimyces thermohalophilus]